MTTRTAHTAETPGGRQVEIQHVWTRLGKHVQVYLVGTALPLITLYMSYTYDEAALLRRVDEHLDRKAQDADRLAEHRALGLVEDD